MTSCQAARRAHVDYHVEILNVLVLRISQLGNDLKLLYLLAAHVSDDIGRCLTRKVREQKL